MVRFASPDTSPSQSVMATVSSTAFAGKRPSAHAAAKHVCLLEADEKRITDAQASSGRKRSIDETVVKMLKDNFKGFTEVNTDLTISKGSSLRQVLIRYKTAQMLGDNTIKFGKTYYDDKRVEFGGRHTPQSVVAVQDDNEVVP